MNNTIKQIEEYAELWNNRMNYLTFYFCQNDNGYYMNIIANEPEVKIANGVVRHQPIREIIFSSKIADDLFSVFNPEVLRNYDELIKPDGNIPFNRENPHQYYDELIAPDGSTTLIRKKPHKYFYTPTSHMKVLQKIAANIQSNRPRYALPLLKATEFWEYAKNGYYGTLGYSHHSINRHGLNILRALHANEVETSFNFDLPFENHFCQIGNILYHCTAKKVRHSSSIIFSPTEISRIALIQKGN